MYLKILGIFGQNSPKKYFFFSKFRYSSCGKSNCFQKYLDSLSFSLLLLLFFLLSCGNVKKLTFFCANEEELADGGVTYVSSPITRILARWILLRLLARTQFRHIIPLYTLCKIWPRALILDIKIWRSLLQPATIVANLLHLPLLQIHPRS